VTDLKPRTRYHCPVSVAGDGYGHSSLYTGDYSSPGNGVCICGAQMVETTEEGLHVLTWEMISPGDIDWRAVRREHRVAHEAQKQAFGLQALIDQGEQIRNIRLVSYDLTPAAE